MQSGQPGTVGPQEFCLSRIESCILEIRKWITHNMLKLKNDKTEFIIFSTRQQLKKVTNIQVCKGNTKVVLVEAVRNLGFFMDKLLKNTNHVNKLTSSLVYQLININIIRDKLDLESAKTITQALALSKLDYCNSLLLWTPECYLDCLQATQSMACRVIHKLRKFDRINSSIKALHWLKIREHIAYKVANLVYRCHNGTGPCYLNDLLPVCQTIRALRCSTSCDITPVFCKTELTKEGSFSVAGPRTWNNLPKEVKGESNHLKFRRKLKTHLFKKSYPEWLFQFLSPSHRPSILSLARDKNNQTTIHYVHCKVL